MKVIIEWVRDLARATHEHAREIGDQKPLSGHIKATDGSPDSEVSRNLKDIVEALDTVFAYHQQRLAHFADLTTKGADTYEHDDRESATRILDSVPRPR